MNYFPDFMALAEIALGAGVGFLITVWFFVMGSKARREHQQRGLKIVAQELEMTLLKGRLKECEEFERDRYLDVEWTEEERETTITTDGTY